MTPSHNSDKIRIALNNGDEILLVEVTKDADNPGWMKDILEQHEDPWYLGTYYDGEIDFMPKDVWVKKNDTLRPSTYWNYVLNNWSYQSYKYSFVSMLQTFSVPNKKYVVLLIKT